MHLVFFKNKRWCHFSTTIGSVHSTALQINKMYCTHCSLVSTASLYVAKNVTPLRKSIPNIFQVCHFPEYSGNWKNIPEHHSQIPGIICQSCSNWKLLSITNISIKWQTTSFVIFRHLVEYWCDKYFRIMITVKACHKLSFSGTYKMNRHLFTLYLLNGIFCPFFELSIFTFNRFPQLKHLPAVFL